MIAYIKLVDPIMEPEIEAAVVMELEDGKGHILTKMDFDTLPEAFAFAAQKGYKRRMRF